MICSPIYVRYSHVIQPSPVKEDNEFCRPIKALQVKSQALTLLNHEFRNLNKEI